MNSLSGHWHAFLLLHLLLLPLLLVLLLVVVWSSIFKMSCQVKIQQRMMTPVNTARALYTYPHYLSNIQLTSKSLKCRFLLLLLALLLHVLVLFETKCFKQNNKSTMMIWRNMMYWCLMYWCLMYCCWYVVILFLKCNFAVLGPVRWR